MALLHLGRDKMEQGLWNYDVQMYDDINNFHLDIFIGKANGLLPNSVEAWADSKLDQLGHPRISLFAASFRPDQSPSKVQAIVSRPGHRGKDLPPVILQLKVIL